MLSEGGCLLAGRLAANEDTALMRIPLNVIVFNDLSSKVSLKLTPPLRYLTISLLLFPCLSYFFRFFFFFHFVCVVFAIAVDIVSVKHRLTLVTT